MKVRTLIVFFLIGVIAACATSPTGRRQLMLVSEQQAILASQEAYVQMLAPLEKEGKIDNNPAVTARVNRITGRLIAQAVQMRPETQSWDWSVKVIDDSETVNAWCMAGGRMAIYTGLIQQIKPSDDELAQVMGHEIAHALANHTAEKMSVAMATQLGVVAVGVVSDRPGLAMTGTALAAALAVQLPNSRTAEAEADRIGIELAAKAGYDPRAAISLWEKMGKLSSGASKTFEFLSTHPAPQTRMNDLAALVPQMMPYYQKPGERPSYPL